MAGVRAAPESLARSAVGSRTQILDAAEELMSRRGYRATSVTDVCRASGLPVGSVYWHFASKAGLLGAVLERANLRFFEQLPRIEDFHGTARERFGLWFEANTDLLLRRGDFLRLYVSLALEENDEPEVREINAGVRLRGHERLAEALLPLFEDAGHPAAQEAAARLGRYMLVSVDGIMLSRQLDGLTDITPLMRLLHEALILLVDGSGVERPDPLL